MPSRFRQSINEEESSMNCPKCGNPMLKMPVWDSERKVMEYYLCLDCVMRVIVKCKWRLEAVRTSPFTLWWCSKTDEPCRLDSDPETGYVFCPQIREWQEKNCGWLRRQNREFEKAREEKLRLIPSILTTPLHPKGRVLSDEAAEALEGELKKKKKVRSGGKYKESRRGQG